MAVHESVMLKEVIDGLNIKSNEDFVDGTVGAGGHSAAILEKNGPAGRLLGFDWDKDAIDNVRTKFAQHGDRVILVNDSYTKIKLYADKYGFSQVNGILLDLGLSLDQLKSSGRGFTFQIDEPLDMRFSLDTKLTAFEIVNHWKESEIEQILREYGEERDSRRLAAKIVKERANGDIKSTSQLVNIIAMVKKVNFRTKSHPATQTFQALRIAVNGELDNVKSVLGDCVDLLKSGGRLAIITFHSLEDRIVKDFFKHECRGCVCPPESPICQCAHKARLKPITRKPMIPSSEEISRNFRARSAKLRVVEKV
jgi:16S rRNA (cytosine1402-N4)-methyltransferase